MFDWIAIENNINNASKNSPWSYELAQYFHNLILSEDFELWRFRDIGSIWRVYPQHPLDPRTAIIMEFVITTHTRVLMDVFH